MLILDLPFPVSANQYWMIAGRKLIKTKVARSYIREVTLYWLNEKAKGTQAFGEDETLALAVALHYPVRRGPDCDVDNCLKVLVDSLETAGVFQNDNQIRHIQITREEAKDKTIGGVRVCIKSCPHEMVLHDGTFIVKEIHG
jgi:Holliday junction resolvase RusA-like endonuclease